MNVMAKHVIMVIDSGGCSMSKQTNDLSLVSDYSWIEDEKAKPWWQMADIDELACFVSKKPLNHIENSDLPPPKKFIPQSMVVSQNRFEGDLSKAQLTEALCHSQTRAREAEEVAKQAYAEKEHIIGLFFIQASQLFAYKQ
ncbi:hypothetical protein RJT34_15676 [Clitoria ternatea]|uniref:Uncharacterized protein n=1 Tax=Clitoria ternatea TaxID=43366 RepID=A0AAN9J648_CLITE